MISRFFKKKKPKIIFFGTPEFCLPTLQKCYELFNVVGVVTQPDRPRGRGHKVSPCPVKSFASEQSTPCFSPASLKKESPELKEFQAFIMANKVDLFVVLAYGNMLPDWALQKPRLGALNLHASLLPKWRGAAPIQRAIEFGNNSTGVSLQKMVKKMDAGDVLHEKKYLIGRLDNSESLSDSLSLLSAQTLEEYFKNKFKGALAGVPQDETQVSFADKITKEEAQWSPEWTSTQTHNKVRAFFLWPKVKVLVGADNKVITLLRTNLTPASAELKLSPGQILLKEGAVYLGTKSTQPTDPVLELLSLQPPGKGPTSAWDFFQNLQSAEAPLIVCTPS